jgi:hypothetical protein
VLFWTAADLERRLLEFQCYYNEHRMHAGRAGAPAGAEPGRGLCSGESPGVSLAAALSWAALHAEGRVTPSILSALTAAIYEFPTHKWRFQAVDGRGHVARYRTVRVRVMLTPTVVSTHVAHRRSRARAEARLETAPKACSGRKPRTCAGRGPESLLAPQSRIRDAVLSGFNVARKFVLETRVG